jgi:hypothetical protein
MPRAYFQCPACKRGFSTKYTAPDRPQVTCRCNGGKQIDGTPMTFCGDGHDGRGKWPHGKPLTEEEYRAKRRAADQLRSRRIQAMPELIEAAKAAEKVLDALMGFYGQGLEVAGWHQNGSLEPLDNFFDDNMSGDELTKLHAALAKVEPRQAEATQA